MSMRLVIVAGVAAAACGPKPMPSVIPALPGDGDAHTAKPPPMPTKKASDDPWAGKSLIAAPALEKPRALPPLPIQELKLANGLTVYVVENHRLPVVAMQLAVKAGRMLEPRARLGVSEVTADLLLKGTQRHDAAALARAIDAVGGTLASDSTFEATLLSCATTSRDRGTCLELLPEVATQPAFAAKELDAVKDRMRADIRARQDDLSKMASLHVQNLLWGNEHVRGWINSERSVGSITREDVATWHKTWFVPGNAMLVVTGDVDGKTIKGELERAFGGWKKAPVPPAPTFPEPGLSGSRIRLVDKPGATQTHVRVAQFGIKHDDPRFYDTLVWNAVLGSGANSRLGKAMRGLAGNGRFGASSSFDRNLDKGSFVVSAFARAPDTLATTKLVLEEVARLQKVGPTPAEVDAAVASIAGGYGLRFQTAADVGGAVIAAALHGLGRDYLAGYPGLVGKVTAGSAGAAANAILDPQAYVVVLVGDAKTIEPQLKREGWRYEKVSIAEPVSPEPAQQETPVDAKALAAVKKLVDDAVTAKGGRAKLAAIKSITWTAKGTTAIQGQSIPVEISRVFAMPDKIRIDATLLLTGDGGATQKVPVIVAVDGQTGWQIGPDRQTGKPTLAELSAQDIAPIVFERWREPDLILLKAIDKAAVVKPIADETIDGKPNAGFSIESPFQGLDVVIYVDKTTKLITRIQYTDGRVTNVDDFADYKPEKGLQVAHKRVQSAGGRVTTMQLQTFELDAAVPADKFAKPAAP